MNNGRTVQIFLNEKTPHKSSFLKLVLDDDDNLCGVYFSQHETRASCKCGNIICEACLDKIKECPQCRKRIEGVVGLTVFNEKCLKYLKNQHNSI
jgi:hypothetical protein